MDYNNLPTTYKSNVNGLRAIIETQAKKGKDLRPLAFDIKKTDMLEDRDIEIGGVETLVEWKTGEGAAETSFSEGFEVKYKQIEFARKLPIGRHMQKFMMNDLGKLSTSAKKLGKSAHRFVQERSYELLSQGAVAGFDHGYNNNANRLFSAQHVYSPENATQYTNIITDSIPPGYDAVQELLELLYNMPDDQGKAMYLGEDSGYCIATASHKDFLDLQQVIHPDADYDPTTSNDAINVFNGKVKGFNVPIELVYIPYAAMSAYPNALFAWAKDEKPFIIQESSPITTDDYMDDESKTRYVRVSTMFDRKLKSPRHVVATLGNGTTTVDW